MSEPEKTEVVEEHSHEPGHEHEHPHDHECGCGHDHDHPHDHKHDHPPRKPRKRPPPRSHDEEESAPYQPPPPPKLHPPQREPLMEEPLPKWDVPIPKILEDKRVDCISTDPGKVIKTVIKAGIDNKQMHINTRVKCHYVGTFDDGTKFNSSRDNDEEFTYLYGKHEVIPGFDAALSTMHTGEIADVVIQADYGYGDKVFDNIPPNSVLHFNIELISYEWEPIEPMDQIEYAAEKKDEGNEKVKEGKWQEAIDIYQKGYNFVEVLMIGDPGQHKMGQDMKLAIALNKAHCYLKLNQPDEALKMCADALKVDPSSVKGKFRRGLCYKAKQDYFRAESDFRSALVSAPNDKAILAELQSLRAVLDPLDKKMARTYRKNLKGKSLFEQMEEEKKREEIARKERELRLIEEEKRLKEEEEKKKVEKEEKKKAEKENEEKEKAEKGGSEGGIVKEPENATTCSETTTTTDATTTANAATTTTNPESSSEGIEKEKE